MRVPELSTSGLWRQEAVGYRGLDFVDLPVLRKVMRPSQGSEHGKLSHAVQANHEETMETLRKKLVHAAANWLLGSIALNITVLATAHITAHAAEFGQKKWEFDAGASLTTTPAIGSNAVVYVTDLKGRLHAIDSTSGAHLWEYASQLGGYVAFSDADLIDAQSFAAKLAVPKDEVSAFVKNRLTATTLGELARWNGTTTPSRELRYYLLGDLNSIRTGSNIWDAGRFSGVTLRPETMTLVQSDPTGEEAARLNRLLLEDAYPAELAKDIVKQGPIEVSPPTIAANGLVVFSSYADRIVHIVDGTSGVKKSKSTIGGMVSELTGRAAIDSSGRAYVLGEWSTGRRGNITIHGSVVALDITTGSELWQTEVDRVRDATVIAPDGTLIVQGFADAVYALDPKTGIIRWKTEPGQGSLTSTVLGADGTLYLSGERGTLYALNAATGVKKWELALEGAYQLGAAVVGPDGMLFVRSTMTTLGDQLRALDTRAGQTTWTLNYSEDANLITSPALSAAGTIYSCARTNLMATSSTTGSLLWKYNPLGRITGSPVIGEEGTVVFATEDGRLHAVQGDAGPPHQGWPLLGSNARLTSQLAIEGPAKVLAMQEPKVVAEGETTLLSVTAGGTPPLGFQWFKDGVAIRDADRISGATGAVLTISDTQISDAGIYSVSVRSGIGAEALSAAASITVRPPEPGKLLWTYERGEDATQNRPPVTIGSGGTIYSASSKGLVAIDPKGGERLWSNDGVGSFVPVLGAGGVIYSGYFPPGNQGALYGLDEATGSIRWKPDVEVRVSAIGPDGVLIGTGFGGLYALDPADGKTRWQASVAGSPALSADGTIYVAWTGGIRAYSPDRGELRLDVSLPNLGLAVGSEGRLYVSGTGTHANHLYAVDGLGGGVLWGLSTDAPLVTTPIVGSEDLVIVSCDNKTTIAADGRSGTLRWRFQTSGRAREGAVGEDRSVYLTDDGGTIYALDATTGLLRWKTVLKTGDRLSPPVISDEGRILVVGESGAIYSVAGGGPPARSPWPLYGCDSGQRRRVTVPGPVKMVGQPKGSMGIRGSQSRFTALAVGSDPIRYQWQKDGLPLTEGARFIGVNTSSLLVADLRPEDTGSYTITASGQGGAPETSAAAILTIEEPAMGTVRWFTDLHFGKEQVDTSPTIGPDGTVFIGSTDGFVHAVDGATGQERWRFAAGSAVITSPSVDVDGSLYVDTRDRELYRLDGQSGEVRWSALGVGDVGVPVALGSGDLIYGGVAGGGVIARKKLTGEEVWTFSSRGYPKAPAAMGPDGTVYITTVSRYLCALDGLSGRVLWELKTDEVPFGSCIAVGSDGVVYLGGGKKLYALDAKTGAKIWEKASSSVSWASPTIDVDGSIAIGDGGGRISALSPVDGTVLWSFLTGGSIGSAPVIAADGSISVLSNDGFLYAIEGGTGTEKQRFQTIQPSGKPESGSPAIASDGTVYLSRGGRLYAIYGSSPLANSPWPMEGRNARHSRHQVVGGAPEIVHMKPMDQSIATGAKARIDMLLAGSDPLEVQWFAFHDDGTTGEVIGATNSLLVTDALQRPVWYWAVVANSVGVAKSGIAFVDVPAPPLITNQPLSGEIRTETSTELSVRASGQLPMQYQWYTGRSGETASQIVGATNETFLTPTLTAPAQYWVRVRNSLGEVDSVSATLGMRGPIAGELLWKASLAGSLGSVAVGDNNNVFVGALNAQVVSLDAGSGSIFWRFTTRIAVSEPPVVGSDGFVYAIDYNFAPSIYRINSSTGVKSWSTSVAVDSRIALDADQSVVATGVEQVAALKSTNGSRKWSVAFQGLHLFGPPAISSSGLIYCGADDSVSLTGGKILAINSSNGQKRWELITTHRSFSPPAIGKDENVYLGGGSDRVLCIAGATGKTKWDLRVPATVSSSPAVGLDEAIYVNASNLDDRLIAIDGSTGAQKWESRMGSTNTRPYGLISSSPTLAADGTVYLGSLDGHLYAFDGSDGRVKWRYQTGNPVGTSPSIGSDGTVYIGSGSNLFAIKGSAPLADTPWPKFSQNARNTGRALPAAPPTVTRQPVTASVSSGASGVLEVTASGTAPLSYQWYIGRAPDTSVPIEGATANSYRTPPLTSSSSFWVRIRNAAGYADSATAEIIVLHAPQITRQPQNVRIARGAPATFSVEASGEGPLSYQWFRGEAGNTGNLIAGAIRANYGIAIGTEAASYWVRVSNEVGNADSAAASMTVLDPPVISSGPASVEVARGAPARFVVIATGSPPLSFQWYLGESGVTTQPIPDALGEEYSTPPLDQTTVYWVRVRNEVGVADTVTAKATVNVPTVHIAVTRTMEGTLRAQVVGSPRTRWNLESTDDLLRWSAWVPPVSVTTNDDGVADFELPTTTEGARLYRLAFAP